MVIVGEDPTKAHVQVAVVTGAARGIGHGVVLVLARRGYAVAVNVHSTTERTLDELERVGQETLSIPGAVSDEAAVREIVRSFIESFGRVDVLVNDAGVRAIVLAEETTLADGNKHFFGEVSDTKLGPGSGLL